MECVMILLEYGIDPMTTNRFGLTALGNMKTRSPMRHKFDDMPEDHPMRRTLVVLEEAERQKLQIIEDKSTSTEDANEHQVPTPKKDTSSTPPKRGSWTQWLLGFRSSHPDERPHVKSEQEQQKSEAGDANTSTTVTEDNDRDSDEVDDLLTYEESRLMLAETRYEPLTPPPEIEEALRRAKANQLGVYLQLLHFQSDKIPSPSNYHQAFEIRQNLIHHHLPPRFEHDTSTLLTLRNYLTLLLFLNVVRVAHTK
ncbi:LOW QUALITY PROTEIN: Hypothetical protein PHPALM_2326 [Phytophthora palmivora]|uniref:Uncharacterized protein n=1 Tax=Phytophthora palmivora TaxID=4796 RepID=A0A2P4YQ16_9STRA|nr:LOW QUALITY PROTEIN: Hypothetical protein PHPALM_2326 [Phytophthora palmivora]